MRSTSTVSDRRVSLQPRIDALDDEEVLAGPDVAELPRLAREAVEARVRLHALLQLALLRRQLCNLRALSLQLVTSRHPAAQRVVVRVADQDNERDRAPSARKR